MKKMGCFYTGFDYKNRKNGYWKIGQTGDKTPAKRLANIRQNDYFQCLGYLLLPEATKADREVVESIVRMKMERAGFKQVQNDHFEYEIKQGKKYEQAAEIAALTLAWAIEACKEYNIKYEIGSKQYKRG